MRLVSLLIRNFRSIASLPEPLKLAHNVCLFYGPNGAGKTTLFDAIELALTGKVERLARFEDAAHYLVRAQSPQVPASVALRAETDHQSIEWDIDFRDSDKIAGRRGILSDRQAESFRTTCYLSQSTIRSLVTCDSSTLGRIIEGIIIDEASETLIQGLLAANITRASSPYPAARQEVKAAEEELQSLEDQLKAARDSLAAVPALATVGEPQIAHLRERMRVLSLPTPSIASNVEVGSAISQLERKVTADLKQTADAKAGIAARISTIESLMAQEERIEASRAERDRLRGRAEELTHKIKDASVRIDKVKQGMAEQRLASADMEQLITALKLLKDSHALTGDRCPVCDQPVTNLPDHVSQKLETLTERNRKAASEIDKLMKNIAAGTADANRLNKELTEARVGLAELDTIIDTHARLTKSVLNYPNLELRSLAGALEFEKRNFDVSTATEQDLLADVKFCSLLRSTLAVEAAKSISSQSEISKLEARIASQRTRVSTARKFLAEVESYVGQIQALRQNLSAWRTEMLEGFAESQANAAFSEFFTRIVANRTFSVGIDSARVIRNKPQIEWRAFHGDAKYVAEGVLSQAELNACAIALFLALATTHVEHPGVLLLDDPVQNMDELHIEELGETLKLLKDTLGWQIIIGVHDLSVYNFLKRQLYPSQEGQSLCAYVLSSASEGTEVTVDRITKFEPQAFDLSFGVA